MVHTLVTKAPRMKTLEELFPKSLLFNAKMAAKKAAKKAKRRKARSGRTKAPNGRVFLDDLLAEKHRLRLMLEDIAFSCGETRLMNDTKNPLYIKPR
jgi:hypothetical protein